MLSYSQHFFCGISNTVFVFLFYLFSYLYLKLKKSALDALK